jgi:outer membrane immunogenic protein
MKPQLLRRIATALAALGMAWPAIAADMPLKGPLLPPPAPVYGWGGYYFGGNIGYSWGKEDLNLSGFAVNGVPIPGADFGALRPHGTVAGGQVGLLAPPSPRITS